MGASQAGGAPDAGRVKRSFVKILSGFRWDKRHRQTGLAVHLLRLLFCPEAAAFHTAPVRELAGRAAVCHLREKYNKHPHESQRKLSAKQTAPRGGPVCGRAAAGGGDCAVLQARAGCLG